MGQEEEQMHDGEHKNSRGQDVAVGALLLRAADSCITHTLLICNMYVFDMPNITCRAASADNTGNPESLVTRPQKNG
jgi:hypothetical protein